MSSRRTSGGDATAAVTYDKQLTALVVIDSYDFISEGGKVWDRLKGVVEARQARLRISYALHRRYRPGDYETWKYVAPTQLLAWSRKTFEFGTWGGEIRSEFAPHPETS
jgi:hypothetical protein